MIPKYYEFQNSAKILSGEFALENIPKELSMLNAKKEDFENIAKKALNDGAIIVNSKQVDFEDIIEILEKAF